MSFLLLAQTQDCIGCMKREFVNMTWYIYSVRKLITSNLLSAKTIFLKAAFYLKGLAMIIAGQENPFIIFRRKLNK